VSAWLELIRGDAPLIVSFPHTGTEIPAALAPAFASDWLARKDADHWLHLLYDFATGLGATTLRTRISRSVIDVNRDPSGVSLYPGQISTELCPMTTFAGEPLYREGLAPDVSDIAARRAQYFAPYHATLAAEITRLGASHPRVVLYDAHAICSRIARLFKGELPVLNIGTNAGAACDAALTRLVESRCARSSFSCVTDGRFRGGYITRHYGAPARGVHALQMELSFRGFLDEPAQLDPSNWPPPYAAAHAAELKGLLAQVLGSCLDFARSSP
jgi:N-formylglutamate deformylase